MRLPLTGALAIAATVLLAGPVAHGAAVTEAEPHGAITESEALTFSLWLRRAEQGGAEAQFTIGYMYATGKGAQLDYTEAQRWFRLAAAQDHPRALWAMGLLYDNAWGVMRDRVEALRWYRLAADKGEPQAQTQVGAFYIEGLVIEQNVPEALVWFRRAAVQGQVRAMLSLGNIYAEGLGVMQDYPRALMWMYLAAQTFVANGTPNSLLQQRVDEIARRMSYRQLEEAARLGELCEQSNYTMCD